MQTLRHPPQDENIFRPYEIQRFSSRGACIQRGDRVYFHESLRPPQDHCAAVSSAKHMQDNVLPMHRQHSHGIRRTGRRSLVLLLTSLVIFAFFAGSQGASSCLLSARPDAARRRLLLSFKTGSSSSARGAEMGIEIGGVVERAAGKNPVLHTGSMR